jgi:hypothetical protein
LEKEMTYHLKTYRLEEICELIAGQSPPSTYLDQWARAGGIFFQVFKFLQ